MKRAIIIIGEIMKYIYLDNNFYNRHPQINYPEILQKKDRPYVQIAISVNNQLWAIPLATIDIVVSIVDNRLLIYSSNLKYRSDSTLL